MRVTFDKDSKVAGIGIAPWPRLGPEKWLPNYKIASYFGWDVQADSDVPEHFSLKEKDPSAILEKLNTPNMLDNKVFQHILQHDLAGYSFLTYKTVAIPPELQGRRFLMVDEKFSKQFENKVEFRKLFGGQLKFPVYKVYQRNELEGSEEEYRTIAAGRKTFVLQDEQLSGGKGTFVVSSYSDYQKALRALELTSTYTRIVVSDAVAEPRERSIQACVTKQGIVTGPLQRQIVRHPALANMDVPTGDKWCGVQIYASDQQTKEQEQAREAALAVGDILAQDGYKGIFGLDFLLDKKGNLFLIEANPRITGTTPLLAALFHDETSVPFYLLHILELGGFEYTIEDFSATFDEDGALLVFHSLNDHDVAIRNKPQSGTYKIESGKLVKISGNLDIGKLRPKEWILQEYTNAKMIARPGMRILTAQTKEGVLDRQTDDLTPEALEDVRAIYSSMYMEAYNNER